MIPLFIVITLTAAFAPASSNAAATPRQLSNPCEAHFGGGGFNTLPSFTLAALNRTLLNANTTGAPLVLGQAGATGGAEFEVFSTWASFQFNQWPTLSLTNGVLTANMDPPNTRTPTVSTGASNGSEIVFVTTAHPPAPVPVFCGVADTDPEGGSPFAALAVNDDTDLFSLCLTSTSPGAQNNVVYNATADTFGAYIFESCYPVTLQIIETQ
ncbi:hypothetical protein K439DRAFT_1622982 [Ramaria rubella]|nr:hypothetical protein K439DRAFT_1622982 [Ramaria rubella]